MSDERLSRQADSLMGRLLAAGDRDEPSPRTMNKTLLAMGVVSGLGGASSAASATTVGAVAIVKWVAIGAIVGASVSVAGGAIVDHARAVNAARERAPSVSPTRASAANTVAPESALSPETPPPGPSASATPASPPRAAFALVPDETEPAPSASSKRDMLKDEAAVIERAGNAVRRHDGPGALAALGEYRQRFPHGQLSLEASVLEVDALVASGQRDAAKRAAQRFLAAHPESPSAKHLRSIAGLSE